MSILEHLKNKMIADEADLVYISDLEICESAAGYYLGHTYYDDEWCGWLPWDRQSDYIATKQEAEQMLAYYQRYDDE